MARTLTISAIVMLLLGSAANAQIDIQLQTWNLGIHNDITQAGGTGNATTTQGVGALDIQTVGINPDDNGDPTVTAGQGIGAALFQTGNTETGGAVITLGQNVTVMGLGGLTLNGAVMPAGQMQTVGDLAGPTLQYQGASVGGDQTLEKGVGSSASADGINLVGFGMGQDAVNNCANGFQLSVILGGQTSTLEGAAQSTGTIETSITADVQQLQMANGI